MTVAEYPLLREIAIETAQAAAAHIRARRPEVFGGRTVAAGDAVRSKSTPSDPVTVVDTESEQLVRDLLARLRPHDGILGEEQGGTESSDGVRWVVDPIDGTVNFLYGIPAYGVSVAAQHDGRTVAGAVVDVVAEATYHAALGQGAARTHAGVSTPLRCTEVTSVDMALVATGFGYAASRRAAQGALVAALLPRVRDIRRVGSAALDLCMVAAGRVDAHYEHGLGPWDWAAGALIAAEAGAYVVAPDPTAPASAGELLLACAPGIADELTKLFDTFGGWDAIPV